MYKPKALTQDDERWTAPYLASAYDLSYLRKQLFYWQKRMVRWRRRLRSPLGLTFNEKLNQYNFCRRRTACYVYAIQLHLAATSALASTHEDDGDEWWVNEDMWSGGFARNH